VPGQVGNLMRVPRPPHACARLPHPGRLVAHNCRWQLRVHSFCHVPFPRSIFQSLSSPCPPFLPGDLENRPFPKRESLGYFRFPAPQILLDLPAPLRLDMIHQGGASVSPVPTRPGRDRHWLFDNPTLASANKTSEKADNARQPQESEQSTKIAPSNSHAQNWIPITFFFLNELETIFP